MSKTVITIHRGDHQTLTVDDTLWSLLAATGLDKPAVELFTQKAAVGDGDIVTGQRVGSRTVELTLKTKRPGLNDVLRRAATSFFRPTYSYDVYVTRGADTRYAADCRLDSLEVPTENQYKPITAKVSLLNPEGYFLSVDSFGRNIAGVDALAGYPFICPANRGRVYGAYRYAGTVYLDNDGDAEAYCRALFYARGTVTNPKLVAGDGFVRVLCTMTPGSTLVIDAKTKSVTLNGANAITKLDRASSFEGIVFALGQNAIQFAADVGDTDVDVYIYYNKRYLGA